MVCVAGGTDYIGHVVEQFVASGSIERDYFTVDLKEYDYFTHNKVPVVVCEESKVWSKRPVNAPIPGRNY